MNKLSVDRVIRTIIECERKHRFESSSVIDTNEEKFINTRHGFVRVFQYSTSPYLVKISGEQGYTSPRDTNDKIPVVAMMITINGTTYSKAIRGGPYKDRYLVTLASRFVEKCALSKDGEGR